MRIVVGVLVACAAARAEAVALPVVTELRLQSQLRHTDSSGHPIGNGVARLPDVVVHGAGVALVNGPSGAGHLTALSLAPRLLSTSREVVPVTDPAASPVRGLQLTAWNQAGAFHGAAGGFGGMMPLAGGLKACLFAACSTAIANLVIPLNVAGGGGHAQVTAAVNLTVLGAAWTTRTAAIGTVTRMGFAGPASNTGAPSGSLSLVTPIFLSTNIGASAVVPIFGVLTLHFVPEPATAVFVATGIAGLIMLGRNTTKRS
jgi:hypothetical protein